MSNNRTSNINETLPQFYPPLYDLKHKVGRGGLSSATLKKAQKVIDNNDVDFLKVAAPYMVIFEEGLALAKKNDTKSHEELIENILFSAMQLKANGGLFHYPIVTQVAIKLLYFLERLHTLNAHALEVVIAFEASIKLIFKKQLSGDIQKNGEEIIRELESACVRFFEKYPENIHPHFRDRENKVETKKTK